MLVETEASRIRSEIARWQEDSHANCSSDTIESARARLNIIQSSVSRVYAESRATNYPEILKRAALRDSVEMAHIQMGAQFDLADSYLEQGCLEDADDLYRDIIVTFTGAAYSGARQRAQVGIDDVRARTSR